MTERDNFLGWHYKQFLSENPNIDASNAKYIYDYSHTHVMVGQIRENLFMAWQASASRGGYKLVPVELIERCISHIGIASCHPANNMDDDIQMSNDIDALEKAIIGTYSADKE